MKDLFTISVKWDLLFITLSFIFVAAIIVFSFTGYYIPFIEKAMRVMGAISLACIFGYMMQMSAFITACEENDSSADFLKAFCIKVQQAIYLALTFELALFMIGTFL